MLAQPEADLLASAFLDLALLDAQLPGDAKEQEKSGGKDGGRPETDTRQQAAEIPFILVSQRQGKVQRLLGDMSEDEDAHQSAGEDGKQVAHPAED